MTPKQDNPEPLQNQPLSRFGQTIANKKCNPCINPKTQKPFDWENPEFTPGIHCTGCRYAILTEPRNPDFKYTCSDCIIKNKLYAWKRRSDAAKRASNIRLARKKVIVKRKR